MEARPRAAVVVTVSITGPLLGSACHENPPALVTDRGAVEIPSSRPVAK